MIYAVVSLAIGVLCFFNSGWPAALPIVALAAAGVALGQGVQRRQRRLRNVALAALLLNAVVVGALLWSAGA